MVLLLRYHRLPEPRQAMLGIFDDFTFGKRKADDHLQLLCSHIYNIFWILVDSLTRVTAGIAKGPPTLALRTLLSFPISTILSGDLASPFFADCGNL